MNPNETTEQSRPAFKDTPEQPSLLDKIVSESRTERRDELILKREELNYKQRLAKMFANAQCFADVDKDEKGVYFADIMPTKSHLSPPWVMGYDHFPLDSCDIKSIYLAEAVAQNWLVVFDHELGIPWGHVSMSDKGKFEFSPLGQESLSLTAQIC